MYQAAQYLAVLHDNQPASLIDKGHIANNIRLAVGAGLDPFIALRMATINVADCYGLRDRGAVAPGKRADLILFENMDELWTLDVWIGGKHVADKGRYLADDPRVEPIGVSGRMNVKDFSEARLALPLASNRVRTIRLSPGSVVTEDIPADSVAVGAPARVVKELLR